MWAFESVFYQIYPLGFCGAPPVNDSTLSPRILKVLDWIPHIQRLGANAIYFSPVWESDSHGYDTRDYGRLDVRLGTNEDFAVVCQKLHESGIRIVLDGVFNHVGRGFWAFQDVLRNREKSAYRDWFCIDFHGNNGYKDGLWYEGWEGHFELVKLNLRNEAVIHHILEAVGRWIQEFHIDGLRLDVAYSLDRDFIKRLRKFCDEQKGDFFLVGEMLHGDYNQLVNDEMLHSVTNYECYKGLYSSFNSMNLFEIAHSLLRQFGPENWTLYKGKHLFNFVDNHDVSRIASILRQKEHLPLIYGLLFSMPGIPCVYYGSEWGAVGEKQGHSDAALRPSFEEALETDLTERIGAYAKAHRGSRALCYGDFTKLLLTNEQLIFQREFDRERIIVAVNAAPTAYQAHFDARAGRAVDILTDAVHDFGGGSELAPYSIRYWKIFDKNDEQ